VTWVRLTRRERVSRLVGPCALLVGLRDLAVTDTLVRARYEQRLSIRRLARRSGLTRAEVREVEHGDPTVSQVQRYARGVGLTFDVSVEEPRGSFEPSPYGPLVQPRRCSRWRGRRHQFRPGVGRLTATLGWQWCDVCLRWVATSTTDMGPG
jgi:transcriptional regulator with XRE-family HTH domain